MDSSFKRVAGPSQAFQQSSMYSKRSGDRGPPPLSSSWEDEGSSRKRRYGGERSRDRRDDHRSGERSRDRRDDYGGGGGDRGYLMPPNGFDSRPPPAPAPPPYGSRGSRGEGSNESRRREWDGHRYGGGGGRGGARDRSGGGYHGGDYHHQGVRSRERDAEGDGRRRRGKNYHRYTSRDWGYDRRQRYSRSRSRNDRRGAGGGGGYRETPPPYRGGRGGGEPPAYPPSHRRDPYYPPDGGSGGYHGGGGGGGAFNGAGGRGGYHYDNGNRSRSPHRASSPYHASRSRSFDDRGRGRENHYHREYKGGGGKEKVRIKKEKKPTASMSGGDSNDSRDDTIGHYRGRPGDLIDKRYKVIQDVGMGTFGRVVECYDQKDRFNVAIKVVRDVRKYAESARIEADILRDVNSQKGRGLSHCVQMFRDFFFDGHCCLVFENLGTSLYEFLKAHDFVPYPLGHVREFARQLLEALEFLHGMKLIHTDLKPENILLANNETVKQGKAVAPASTLVKVIDFGGATYDDDDHKSTIVNTRQYRAPEVILEVGWSYPSDLWSAGCIIAELYTGDLLFATHNNMEHLALMERCLSPFPREMLERSKIAPKFFDMSKLICSWRDELDKESKKHVRSMQRLEKIFERHNDSGLTELIQGLLTVDPKRRLTAKQALRLPFFDVREGRD